MAFNSDLVQKESINTPITVSHAQISHQSPPQTGPNWKQVKGATDSLVEKSVSRSTEQDEGWREWGEGTYGRQHFQNERENVFTTKCINAVTKSSNSFIRTKNYSLEAEEGF